MVNFRIIIDWKLSLSKWSRMKSKGQGNTFKRSFINEYKQISLHAYLCNQPSHEHSCIALVII